MYPFSEDASKVKFLLSEVKAIVPLHARPIPLAVTTKWSAVKVQLPLKTYSEQALSVDEKLPSALNFDTAPATQPNEAVAVTSLPVFTSIILLTDQVPMIGAGGGGGVTGFLLQEVVIMNISKTIPLMRNMFFTFILFF